MTNLNVERTLLGKILQNPDKVHSVIGYLKPAHFSSTQHKIIFSVFVELVEEGSEPGLISVTSKLSNEKNLEAVGGEDYLKELYKEEYAPDNLKDLADIMIKEHIVREAQQVGYGLLKLEDPESAEAYVVQSAQQLYDIAVGGSGLYTESISTILREEWESIKERLINPGISGISTGFDEYDMVLSGLNPTDLIIVAARPSQGKTSLAIRQMINIAKNNVPVLLFSYEMSKKQLSQRMVAMESGVGLQNIRTGAVTDDDLKKIKDVYLDISSYPIYIDSNMAASIGYVASTIRRYVTTHGVRVVFVDYLQLMTHDADNETKELGRITRALKMLAMELGITVVALSQLNRDVEGRDNKRPLLSDIRQSGRIEEDADVVTMIYRPAMYGKVDNDKEFLMELLVRKNRNGPTGTVRVYFNPTSVNVVQSLKEVL